MTYERIEYEKTIDGFLTQIKGEDIDAKKSDKLIKKLVQKISEYYHQEYPEREMWFSIYKKNICGEKRIVKAEIEDLEDKINGSIEYEEGIPIIKAARINANIGLDIIKRKDEKVYKRLEKTIKKYLPEDPIYFLGGM